MPDREGNRGIEGVMIFSGRGAVNFAREHPLARHRPRGGNAGDMTERIDKGLLDFGLLTAPTDMREHDSFRLPAFDVWGVRAREDGPPASLDAMRPEDLRDLPPISSPAAPGERRALETDRAGFRRVERGRDPQSDFQRRPHGRGRARPRPLPRQTRERAPGSGTTRFKPPEPALESETNVARKKGRVFSKTAEKFLSSSREECGGW